MVLMENTDQKAAVAAATTDEMYQDAQVAVPPSLNTTTGTSEPAGRVAESVDVRLQCAAQPSDGQQQQHTVSEGTADLLDIRNQVINTLREWYVMASDSIASLLDGRVLQQPPKELWLLGKHYNIEAQAGEQSWLVNYPPEVISDFSHLVWCTYRSQYPPIDTSAFTTDAGWGCMLRAGQMLMAQALQLHHLGRDWVFNWSGSTAEDTRKRKEYIGIVKQFFDNYSPTSFFSIHRMAALGRQFEGKNVGEWFGPHGTARILRGLALQAEHEVSVYTTTDGVVYLADICEEGEFKPTLILVASMLGIDRVNPVYYPFIQASLMLPQSAGIAGGRPSSALYFAGFQGDELLYLDPHYTRPVVKECEGDGYSQADLATYCCSTPRRIPLSRLDPCMVFGYYCGTPESLADLRSRVVLLTNDGVNAIMSFDEGHSPDMEAPPAISLLARDTDMQASKESQAPQFVKLPRSPSEGSSTRSSFLSRSKSDSSEIVLESECSDEEWVTDL
ncbi:Cysteine protease atg4 [Coemansia guatemalensis]|uniref:Cysteine protease n=1 Tax=Coemansia guatemalensis TaxID=2761395 RepID=A0A9W8LUM8_9FUNG|nr:Cysteine protease atg4 [Coemansia guatemalensis]